MNTTLPTDCPLCGATTSLAFAGHRGYQAPARFDIYECPACETSYAWPLAVDERIYELIYRNAERIPGYDRYRRYRDLLLRAEDPLAALGEQEDVYWSIGEALRGIARGRGETKILEIGSGFGYLTYALRRAGYDCSGIDISETAVASARRDFGEHYRAADLFALGGSEAGTCDVVVMTELIEHVPNPLQLLARAAQLLKPGGALVITTPSRDLYASRHVWHTDPPPVHLWWFSRSSLRFAAWKLGMTARFVDFRPFYRRPLGEVRVPSKPPTFDADGQVCFSDSAARSLARKAVARWPGLFRPLARTLLLTLAIGKLRDRLFRDSLSLCVILQDRRRSQ